MQEVLMDTLWARFKGCEGSFSAKKQAEDFVENLYQFLFLPMNVGNKEVFVDRLFSLKKSFTQLMNRIVQKDIQVAQQTDIFFDSLSSIYKKLQADAETILNFDPAAESLEEIFLAYPGFFATYVHRVAHQLSIQNIPVLPRVFSEYAHSKTGIDIHPKAVIGDHFFIDHGTGIVIGETTQIGNNVKIYQGVTLGALNVSKEEANTKRHPTVEDDVIIYSGATILGGTTVIGKGSIIGGNVWLTKSVLSNSVVYHTSEVRIKDNLTNPDAINFVI